MRTLRFVTRLLASVSFGALLIPTLQAQGKPKKDRDLITRDELLEAADKSPDLYQAVKRLRPNFLTVLNRGPSSVGIKPGANGGPPCDAVLQRDCPGRSDAVISLPVVYVDGMKTGEPDVLKGIATKNVEEVRYLTPTKAEMDYGLGHEGGAILVKLIKQP